MSIFEEVNEGIKTSMKQRDKVRLEALRGIKKEFLEAITAKGSDGTLHDDQALKILQKMHKQRKESANIYTENGRPELAESELAEAEVIATFLPKMLSEDEVMVVVKKLMEENSISDMKMMGKLMGLAQKKLAGKAEGSVIAACAKKLLAQG
ncbi:GatB/YqeY domain-containing protein [Falsiporphyromonas endometrii]|uniref:GatB/YqeY domain-containing protein n=1 Tax=Falsiporphyromonas endometrii TaxID=1387297 RepID=A0ABV9K9P6_9PORP